MSNLKIINSEAIQSRIDEIENLTEKYCGTQYESILCRERETLMNVLSNATDLITEIEKTSERNSCLTQLATARLQIIQTIDRMAFNDGNDANANWAKLRELKEQADKLDDLIRTISLNNK